MIDTKAWEVDTLRGHVNSVSCAMFHARQDVGFSDRRVVVSEVLFGVGARRSSKAERDLRREK